MTGHTFYLKYYKNICKMSTVFENNFPRFCQNKNIFPLAQKALIRFLQYDESMDTPLTKAEKMVFSIL